jgi:membrane-associated phospholipid phosphatase
MGSCSVARRRPSGHRVARPGDPVDPRSVLLVGVCAGAVCRFHAVPVRGAYFDQFLFVFAVGVLLCYAQFPFWLSDPPRVTFAGENVSSYLTVFRRFNLWTVGNYGIHTSVFPSAHVAGTFAAAFGSFRTLPERRWVGRLVLTMACLIAVATIYGRYHYIADAGAGLAVAIAAASVTASAHLPALCSAKRFNLPSGASFPRLHRCRHCSLTIGRR